MGEVTKVTIIGAGTMGAGIAQVCAQAGYQTTLFDADRQQIVRAKEQMLADWGKGIARGKVTEDQKAAWLTNFHHVEDFERAIQGAELIIEAVPEKLALKQAIFAKLAAQAAPGCILGTNTSSLSIRAIAEVTTAAARIVGMHFFNPVPRMPLLELVWHDELDPMVLARVEVIARELGKEAIVVKDSPGFATSRLGVLLGNEAMRMLEEGVASVADIDRAMRLGYRHPMGPLELSDLVGLDVRLNITEALHDEWPDGRYTPPAILRRLVAAGETGRKVGLGFYDWRDGPAKPRVF